MRLRECFLFILIRNVFCLSTWMKTPSSMTRREISSRHVGRLNSISGSTEEEKTRSNSASARDGASKNYFAKHWTSIKCDSQDDLKMVSASFLISILIRMLLFEPRFIPSLSMFPTFDIGDQLLVDKFSHFNRAYSRKDVVVFNPSDSYVDMTGSMDALIKRVVAVGGDTVEIKNSLLFVNGLEQIEPYINEQPDYTLPLQIVPAGMLMMLGDNRNHSFDSHVWGFVPEENIIGRAVVKYWPPLRVGFIEGSD